MTTARTRLASNDSRGQHLEFGACDASIADSQPPVPDVIEANQHGTIISANACVDGALADYLIKPRTTG